MLCSLFLNLIIQLFDLPEISEISATISHNADITIQKIGANVLVREGTSLIFNNTDSTKGIQRGLDSLSPGQEMYIYNGTYDVKRQLNFSDGIDVRGQGDLTIMDFSEIGNREAMVLGEGSRLSEIMIAGSIKPLPQDFTQSIRAKDNAAVDNVTISNMGFGIDTTKSQNVVLSNIRCEFIQSESDWAACIHGANTNNLSINGFKIVDSNRGIELDAMTNDVTVQNGLILRVKNFNNTGHEAFSLDAHSHDGEGGNENIRFLNVRIVDSFAPSAKVTSLKVGEDSKYEIEDLPKTILFQNITLVNPKSAWQVNGQNITIKDSIISNSSTQDVIVLYENSRDILIDNVTSYGLSKDNCFICNTSEHADLRNISVTNTTIINSPDKEGPTLAFYGVDGLTLLRNKIHNAPFGTEAIQTVSVNDIYESENNIAYMENPIHFSNNQTASLWRYATNIGKDTIASPIIAHDTPAIDSSQIMTIGDKTIKEYTNTTFGITLLYPSEWKRIDWRSLVDFLSFYDIPPNDNFTEVVQLYSRYQNISDKYAEGIDIAVDSSRTDHKDLKEYMDSAVSYYRGYQDFRLIESDIGDSYLAGNPAYKIVFTFTSDNIHLKWMETAMVKNNIVYKIIFFSEAQEYQDYFPTAQSIIESFKIVNETVPLSNNNAHA